MAATNTDIATEYNKGTEQVKNLNWQEGRPVGYVPAQLMSSTSDYLE